ncbi:polar growth protein [Pseudocyphellaria aurata]|nr:polar growth protein [Pseudocyphellaria aurata]
MALRHLGGSPKKALPGQMLLVIHDFEARSPDELSLQKGERIELIERDDDFGDGWYLGKHAQNGRVGLFPEVYTTVTPRVTNHVGNMTSPGQAAHSTSHISNLQRANSTAQNDHSQVSPTLSRGATAQASQVAFSTSVMESLSSGSVTPPPLNTVPPSHRVTLQPNSPVPAQSSTAPITVARSLSVSLGNHRGQGEESPVMNETLSVIDEHITDMNTPRSSVMVGERRVTNDSSSDYSTHIDHRLSYINGHETDEEERELPSEGEVLSWGPKQVAECLKDIGVESRHCEVFREQEISGEVLLAMDQTSIFVKEFDLGLVGRRLRTWHKIKAFQDEVRKKSPIVNKSSNLFSGDGSHNDYESGSRRKSTHPSTLPHLTHFVDQSESDQSNIHQDMPHSHLSLSPQLLQRHKSDANSPPASVTFSASPDGPLRPSAASVREFNHSRRHSAIDFATTFGIETPSDSGLTPPGRVAASPHKKVPSLDRNWTMGGAVSSMNGRPFSAVTSSMTLSNERNTFDPYREDQSPDDILSRDLDRGYASGSELESKKSRNVLRKRDVVSATHSRQNSNLEDQRRAPATGSKRQSRFGSVDSIRDTVASITAPASKLYHGASIRGRFRNSSIGDTVLTKELTKEPLNNLSSPAVTKLEYDPKPNMHIVTSSPKTKGEEPSNDSPSSLATPKSASKHRTILRATSEAVTGSEKALVGSPASKTSVNTAVQSPTRTGSTTPSGASRSIELESTDASSKGTNSAPTGLTPTRAATRRKPKKETSAYVRGLEQKSPQEQMIGCDYNGWMKKKSSNLMTTWKPRLFVLRGRRLSYYYSETDTEEKGLIDISSHRVLPADNDFITGIHATVTGAKASPISPSSAHSSTLASVEAAAHADSTTQKTNTDAVFIFKLVPPRTGLSRAVNFTKPTVHYFAVDNIIQGRLWMGALMKATIDRDETKPVTTTFHEKTISLVKARALRHRPPALMGSDEKVESLEEGAKSDETGLNIQDVDYDTETHGLDLPRAESFGN